MGDRIEAATVAMAVAATGGCVDLDGITLDHLPVGLITALAHAGIALAADGQTVRVQLVRALSGVEVATGPHPGFPTDSAPQLAALLTQAAGPSLIGEWVYPRRDTHVVPLRAFGAELTVTGSMIRLHGPRRLHAADVQAADIRAVAALLIAALAADGTSTIRGLHHLRRGYGHLLPNLARLGAEVTIEPEV